MMKRLFGVGAGEILRLFWTRMLDLDQPRLWLYALLVGTLSGYAALLFYWSVAALQILFFGTTESAIETSVSRLDWWVVLGVPTFGGLAVGLILARFSHSGRVASVAEVIEACVVHLGATLAAIFSRYAKVTQVEARILLGCAAAAAVSSSFNAPIAGALFALEVVLGYYAVRAFAPIVIASVAGAVISRSHLGDFPAFWIPDRSLATFWELPAFGLLGVVSAITATFLMAAIIATDTLTDRAQERWSYPLWLEPAAGGFVIGCIALIFPQVVGVGYETTSSVLYERIPFWTMIGVVFAKIAAVAVTLATRFGGGVFSPSLMLGALTGGAFGVVATAIFPDLSSSYGLYALAGMGAVAAAVLGAPISTSLIVFELTGDYQTAVAVMVSVSVATVLTQQVIERSYFHWRLGNRGLHLGDGPQRYLLDTMIVGSYMLPRGAEGSPSEMQSWDLIEQGVSLSKDDTMQTALSMFSKKLEYIPIVSENEGGGRTLTGALFHIDALRAYNRALVEAHEEEHG